MAIINKGNLSKWLIAAAVGVGALAHKYTDDIAETLVDPHEGVVAKNGVGLNSAVSLLRGGGSQDDQLREIKKEQENSAKNKTSPTLSTKIISPAR